MRNVHVQHKPTGKTQHENNFKRLCLQYSFKLSLIGNKDMFIDASTRVTQICCFIADKSNVPKAKSQKSYCRLKLKIAVSLLSMLLP